MSEQSNPFENQMATDSSGDDAVGTTQDPEDHPQPRADMPTPDEERPASYDDEPGADFPDEERDVPDEISDGDAVAGNPDSASPAEPGLPADVGADAVPPHNAATNEYDKE